MTKLMPSKTFQGQKVLVLMQNALSLSLSLSKMFIRWFNVTGDHLCSEKYKIDIIESILYLNIVCSWS